MLTAISLYTGLGGLDFGIEAAGFSTVVAVEMDPGCCRTLRANRRWPVIEASIAQVTSRQILASADLMKGEADVLVAGPPCQPFSKSSFWVSGEAQRMSDPRARTLHEFLRVLRETQPKTFLLENVNGIAYRGKSEGLNVLVKGIQRINRETGARYSINCATLNAADFGVPQSRERVFIVGSRDGRSFEFPRATHAEPADKKALDAGLKPYMAAWDAIGGLRVDPNESGLDVNGKWGALLPSIPEGTNYLWHTSRGGGSPLFGWRTRYWSFLLKLAKARPSWTIQASPGAHIGPFHWDNRRLTVEELCRLQTLPKGLRFDSSRTELQRMIGNAVPSLLAEVLARHIREQLLDSPACGPLKLRGRRRGASPSPRPPAQVPTQYLHLVGHHSAHPGKGKGIGAARRKKDAAGSVV